MSHDTTHIPEWWIDRTNLPIQVTWDSWANMKLLKKLEADGYIVAHVVKMENGRDNKIKDKILPVAVWGHSRWDECVYWDENDTTFEALKRIVWGNNTKDIMQLEAHIRNWYDIFVTGDKDDIWSKRELLYTQFGIKVVLSEELKEFFYWEIEWKETTLGEVTDRIGDWLHWTPIYSIDWEYYFINWNNIDNGKIIIKEDTKRVSQSEYEKHKKDLSESTLLLWINWTVWNLAKYRNEKCILGKSAAYLNIKSDVAKDFIYYLMLDSKFQYSISKNANGSTIKNVWLAQLRSYRFLLPPLPEQLAIAEILSSLDAKIELLREQNEILEKTAQTIFHEWFGRYSVESPEELPEGWRVGKVSDFGKIVCGKTPPKDNPDYFWWDIPFIKIPDMHGEVFIVQTEDSLTEDWANSQINKFVPRDSICVSCIATVGLVTIPSRDSQTNQQINTVVPEKPYYREYLYLTFMNMKDELIAIGSGWSATLNINTGIFSNIDIFIPDEQILKEYHEKISPMFEKILSNLLQIQSLSKTRDTLLPKLMSGEVRLD